ncbi:MAG: hypothetical protein RLZZ543_2052 [Bacteroidota bacterium]
MHFMLKRFLLLFFFVLNALSLFGQKNVQQVTGRVLDKESNAPLPFANVIWDNNGNKSQISMTNEEGYFKMERIPVGRQNFEVRLVGYQTIQIPDVIVTAGKVVVLNILLEESIHQLYEVEISASDKTENVNEMTILSSRQFRVEETERYPGSRQDPARMASNFAGVQGTNDTRNDIVIRGNSPSATLWRLEDIDIPNPNHFAVPGSMGGPVSILNNKYLGNSDFLTGAFPAMYGNVNGGVFDVKMRNGNQERNEHTFQFGVLGTELTSEGPISKESRSSYIATYRYSTLDMLQGLNLKIGTDAVPKYQDMGFRINMPTKKAGTFSLWSIGGMSNIDIVVSDKSFEDIQNNESYGDKNRDQYFTTNMGVAALSHVISLNKNTWMKTSIAASIQSVNAHHDLIIRDTNSVPIAPYPRILNYQFKEQKSTLAWFVHSKLNVKSSIRAGFFATRYAEDLYDEVKIIGLKDSIPALVTDSLAWKVRENYKGSFYLFQPYVQWKYRISELLTLSAGVYSQHLSLNNQTTVEPRLGIRWNFKENQAISFGAGLHSQMQQTYVYFAIPDSISNLGGVEANTQRIRANEKMGFTRSSHLVLGYDRSFSQQFRVKVESYYQTLWNVPVYAVSSGVSLINSGATFSRFMPLYDMSNTGTGRNYGVELTVEKFFSKHYFFLFSGSLYDSKYTGSNGKTYDSDFNGKFILNLLGGVEYPVGKSKKNTLGSSTKLTYAGGRRYSPVDIDASARIYDVVPLESSINSLQFPNYFRWDLRVAYKINRSRYKVVADGVMMPLRGITHEFAVDLVNVLNIRNVLALSYSPDPKNLKGDPLVKNYQLGFLPLVYYKIDF